MDLLDTPAEPLLRKMYGNGSSVSACFMVSLKPYVCRSAPAAFDVVLERPPRGVLKEQ
jgi:hypothetical protein